MSNRPLIQLLVVENIILHADCRQRMFRNTSSVMESIVFTWDGAPSIDLIMVVAKETTPNFWPIINIKNIKWVKSGNTTITNRRQPHGTARKRRSTITRHQEDKLSKATSSLFPIKMTAILEETYSNVQQNIEQLQNPTMGVTINNKSTITEPPP